MGQAPFSAVRSRCRRYAESVSSQGAEGLIAENSLLMIETAAHSAQNLRLAKKGACPISVFRPYRSPQRPSAQDVTSHDHNGMRP